MAKFKWSQDWRHVFITVEAKGAAATAEADRLFEVTEDGALTAKFADAELELKLAEAVEPGHPKTSFHVKPNSVDMTVRKAAKAFWPFLLAGGKAANKLKNMDTDWDRWVDEDDCVDTEADDNATPPQPEHAPPSVPFESSASALSESSPLAGGDEAQRERFQGLKTEEKMVLFTTMWNCSSQEERGAALQKLASLVDGGDEAGMSSKHIKGGEVLRDRDTSAYGPVTTGMVHLEKWMAPYQKLSEEEKVATFALCWGWCDETEKRLTMAGLT